MSFCKFFKLTLSVCSVVLIMSSFSISAFAGKTTGDIDKNSLYQVKNTVSEADSVVAQPVLKKLKNTQSGFLVSWYKVKGAEKYRVYVKNGSAWNAIGTTTENSFIHKNVKSGKTYTYTVQCVNADESKPTSSYDENGVSGVFLATPVITKITNTIQGAEISWKNIDGASKYRVYYKKGDSWEYIGATDKTTFEHKIKKSNSKYTYTVRAVDETGNIFSDYSKKGKSNTYIATPILKKTKNTTSGILVSWGKVNGADKYKVFVKVGSSWEAIGTTKSNSFTHTGVTSGKRYKYTVRCISANENNYTSYFDTKGKSHIHLSAPKKVKFNNAETGTEITWAKVTGATKYKVYIKNGKAWKYMGSTSKPSFFHKISKTNARITYTIIASNINSGYSSAYYTDGFSNLFVAPPTISSVTYNDNGYLLKWKAVSGASKYRVYRRTAASGWKSIADVNGTQFLDKTAKKCAVYMYTLRCLDENSKLISGYRNDNSCYSQGEIVNNRIMKKGSGYCYVGADGVICKSEEIQLAVNFLMKYGKGDTPDEKLKTAFMYMARNYPYNRSYDHPQKASDMGPLAVDIFRNKKGNCFRQASALACMARAAGYRARVVVGETISASSGLFVPHGWTEIYVDGKWLICDMNAQMRYEEPRYYMLTYHYWTIKPLHRYEVVVSNGETTWK